VSRNRKARLLRFSATVGVGAKVLLVESPARDKPLTARLVGRRDRERRGANARARSSFISLHFSIRMPPCMFVRIAVLITTGPLLRALRDRTAAVC
jgi:hypothetical protein